MKNVCLVGIGPHAKRIYIQYLKSIDANIKLVIEIASNKQSTLNYLQEQGITDYTLYCVDDEDKDNKFLTEEDATTLAMLCKKLEISHAIISTEPKAHNSYLNFFIDNKINVLSDKPITVSKNMMKLNNIYSIKRDFENLVRKCEKNTVDCQIMCQRTMHKGYLYIKELLKDVISCYNIPITFIEVFHSDGKWMMPHDLNCENHPYKYGYGKLFHSGYHFIQLLADFLQLNDIIDDKTKHAKKCELYSTFFTPNDELATTNYNDYKSLFKGQNIPEFYNKQQKSFNCYGEKNNYSILTLKNADNKTITVAELNLLQNSFSRRGWINTKADEYKDNGRIRHEYLNLEVGTLMNIKVHSYQSKEIRDRTSKEDTAGGLEHFDIEIYRNVDIIGGEPYECIHLKDLYEHDENSKMGYNEKARDEFVTDFLNNKADICNLKDHQLAVEILTQLCLNLREYNINGKTKPKRFLIGGKHGIS